MDAGFKVPSIIPQDLLLIQDLIGTLPPFTVSEKRVPDSPDSSDDSIASTDSEDEVEAGLAPRDDDSGVSVATSDSASLSDSESNGSSSSDSETGNEYGAHQQQGPPCDVEDEESSVTTAATYLQTRNEIVDAGIMVPTISEVEPCDVLEKVGEVMSIVGNIVIVRGLPMDHPNTSSERALDAGSLFVFEDRKVLGYIYETFGPTSQPLYQVKFSQYYPLDTDKVRVSREVFHVPQQSRFVFVDQLKNLRGSDASNVHDEEPADDEIEFSDDEKEVAFKAQRRKRHGRSASSSRQSTPAPPRAHIDDMFQDARYGSNPYDAHGPYDDDYHVAGPSRPPPIPYDDPYADIPASDIRGCPTPMGMDGHKGEPNDGSGGGVVKAYRGRIPSRGTRGRGVRNHQLWGSSKREYRHSPVPSPRRTLNSDASQSFPTTSCMDECTTGYEQMREVITSQPLVQPASDGPSGETNNFQGYGQPFVQPHINPRFAPMFGLNLPSGSIIPWVPYNVNPHDHTLPPCHWVDTWTMHSSIDSEGKGDTYRPM